MRFSCVRKQGRAQFEYVANAVVCAVLIDVAMLPLYYINNVYGRLKLLLSPWQIMLFT